MLPKSSQDDPNDTKVASFWETSNKVSKKYHLDTQKYPRRVPKEDLKSQKNVKTRAPKIGLKNIGKTSKKLPKGSKKDTNKRICWKTLGSKKVIGPRKPSFAQTSVCLRLNLVLRGSAVARRPPKTSKNLLGSLLFCSSSKNTKTHVKKLPK